jgi:hypothetical protein
MVFNQTARTLGNLELFGIPQKLGRDLGGTARVRSFLAGILVVPVNGNGRIIKDRPAKGSAAFPSSGDHSKTMDPALMAVEGEQPDADRVPARHQAIAVVLDHPVGAVRQAVGVGQLIGKLIRDTLAKGLSQVLDGEPFRKAAMASLTPVPLVYAPAPD